MVWTTIPDGDIDPDSPITTALMTALRDNPVAIANGDTGAPRITPASMQAFPYFSALGDGSDGSLTYSATTNISRGIYQCTDLTIEAGVTLGITNSNRGFLVFMVQGLATIAGTINLNAKGSPGGGRHTNGANGVLGGAGGGGASSGDVAGNGGSGRHGHAAGGNGGAGSGNGGGGASASADIDLKVQPQWIFAPYYSAPVSMFEGGGGGGGSGSSATISGAGGNGGGTVIIIADKIDFTGSVSCNGGNGSVDDRNVGAGGGGGGFIYLCANKFLNSSGTLSVNGGAGGNAVYDGGAGGAGHAAIIEGVY